METFQQWLYTGPGHFELETVERVNPDPGMVRLAVKAFSICGSDLQAFRTHHYRMKPPLVLGHEFCGIVDAVGDGVHNFKPGDRVGVNPVLSCGKCWLCRNGLQNVCANRHNTGTTVFAGRFDGGMREYTYMPESALMHLPDSLDFVHAALIEPVGVCVHLAERGYESNEKYTLIYGCGPVGLMTLLILKAKGIEHVICVDIRDNRLQLAKDLGASLILNSAKENVKERVLEFASERGGVDRVILGTDAYEPFLEAMHVTRMAGTVVMTGHIRPTIQFRPEDILERGLKIETQVTFLPTHLQRSMQMINDRKIDVDRIITRIMPFKGLQRACEILTDPACKEIKIVIDVTDKSDTF